MSWTPCLVRPAAGGDEVLSLGPDVDDYLRFVAVRARPNTLLAIGFDLKVFFSVVPKEPAAVTSRDVLAFLKAQRAPRRGAEVVRLEDGGGRIVGADRQAATHLALGPVRVPGGARRRGGAVEPGAQGLGDPPVGPRAGPDRPAVAHPADSAQDLEPDRCRRGPGRGPHYRDVAM